MDYFNKRIVLHRKIIHLALAVTECPSVSIVTLIKRFLKETMPLGKFICDIIDDITLNMEVRMCQSIGEK